MKIVAIIPARLKSTRFPNKVLKPINSLPMIEHVRRRALMSEMLDDVIVATCDQEIRDTITSYGGSVLMTSNEHINGTTRIAEAVRDINCTHVLLLQGDEPLILPRHIDLMIQHAYDQPTVNAWNLVGKIESDEELDRHSFVKCTINQSSEIIYCFRRSPYYSNPSIQKTFVKKMLGMMIYRKQFLQDLCKIHPSPVETNESIEQLRIIENNFEFKCVEVTPTLPSVNEPHELEEVLVCLSKHSEQQDILNNILSQ